MRTFTSKKMVCLISILILSLFIRVFFLGNRDLLIEEAYYWNYTLHFDFGYLDHPPFAAVLIKLSTMIFGVNEFGVRCPAILCWFVTAYFSYKWSELIYKGTGIYALLLLSILPFFVVYSFFMTPDVPFMACWSAGLYLIYQALHCDKSKAWYYVGIAVGLGLLAKYTMVLFVLTTFIYLLATPKLRFWFLRKEPYIAIIIALVIFSPVIYWNFIHDWASFAFQSTRRIQDDFHFTFHYFIGLIVLFLTPVGVVGFIKLYSNLFKKNEAVDTKMNSSAEIHSQNPQTISFFRYYMLIPLSIFGLFSLTHEIKFDWIGPIPLAIIPWLAVLMQNKTKTLHEWFITSFILLLGYAVILFCIAFGRPEIMNQVLFNKVISWNNLTQQFDTIAVQAQEKGEPVVLIPIDSYGIESELVFYQTKLLQEGKIQQFIPVRSGSVFGFEGLMFSYWYKTDDLQNKTIIVIAKSLDDINKPSIRDATVQLSPVMTLWGHSQGKGKEVREYYYQLVRLKSDD